MKWIMKIFTVILLAGIVTTVGCKKDKEEDPVPVSPTPTTPSKTDSIRPVITLLGESYITLGRNSEYEDAGAQADDDVDGNITDLIEVTSNLDKTKFGFYNIIFSVQDKAGNVAVPVVRNIEIVFGRNDFFGEYAVTKEDGCAQTTPLNPNQQIIAGVGSDEIIFSNFLTALGGDVPATVDGRVVNMTKTTIQGIYEISGNGKMDVDGNVITMSVTISNTIPIIGSTQTCELIYTRK